MLDFDGGQITGEAGLILLHEFDERLGLTAGLNERLNDQRGTSLRHALCADRAGQRVFWLTVEPCPVSKKPIYLEVRRSR